MKKILVVALALCLVVSLAACGGGDQNNATDPNANDQQPLDDANAGTMPENPPVDNNGDANQTNAGAAASSVEQFENGLTAQGLQYQKTAITDKGGALEAYTYQIGEGKVDLYLFEADSDALKTVTDAKALTLESGSVPAEIKGNYAIVVQDDTNKDKIMEVFNALT